MPSEKTELLQGTLDLLVLQVLQGGAKHGWDIASQIQIVSKDVLQVNQGSLYPALHRLESRGLVSSTWDTTGTNRRARFYKLSPAGKRHLAAERESWERFVDAVSAVLRLREGAKP